VDAVNVPRIGTRIVPTMKPTSENGYSIAGQGITMTEFDRVPGDHFRCTVATVSRNCRLNHDWISGHAYHSRTTQKMVDGEGGIWIGFSPAHLWDQWKGICMEDCPADWGHAVAVQGE
jgi:hypothetical protein